MLNDLTDDDDNAVVCESSSTPLAGAEAREYDARPHDHRVGVARP